MQIIVIYCIVPHHGTHAWWMSLNKLWKGCTCNWVFAKGKVIDNRTSKNGLGEVKEMPLSIFLAFKMQHAMQCWVVGLIFMPIACNSEWFVRFLSAFQ